MNATPNKVEGLSLASIPAGGASFNDGWVAGSLDPALLARQITIAFGTSEKSVQWKSSSLTVGTLVNWLSNFQRGSKDGDCLLQGKLAADGGRSSKGMTAQHLLIFDIDTGQTLEEVANKLPADMFAILWTTHSHNKVESFIPHDDIMKKLERTTPGPTVAEAVAYKIKKTKARPEIFEGTSLGPSEHTTQGIGYRLKHKPWPKCRVLLVLEKHFVFAERGGTHAEAIAEWKARGGAFAESLGLAVDKSCADPGRLFFSPRIPEGAQLTGDDHDIWIIPGQALDFEAVKLPPKPEKAAKAEKTKQSAAAAPGEGFKTANLQRFLAICASSFRAADFIRDATPEDVRHDYDGGQKIDARCPQEDGHTIAPEDDRAFYAINGAGDPTGFQLYCAHAGCLAATTRNGKHDRGVMLDLLCDAYGVGDAAELLQWCSEEAQEQWAPPDPFVEVQQPPTCPRVIRVSSLAGKPVPERKWHVPGLMPASNATLLFGDGATGKSLFAAQTAVATVLCRKLIGHDIVQPGPVLYIGAEDDEDEMHRRFAIIAGRAGASLSDLYDLHLYCLTGHEAILGAVDRNEVVRPTALWGTVRERIMDIKPTLVIYDTLADLFAGNENSRGQARQFIGQIRRPAIETKGTALLLAHPSLSGIASGTGTSGSTGWSNSVRSRLYLSRVCRGEDRSEADPDVRILTVKKTNYAGVGDEHKVRWEDGVFVPDLGKPASVTTAHEVRIEEKFLELLRIYNADGRNVSASRSIAYAPTVFCRDTRACGITKKEFEAAMNRLFDKKKIRLETEGPESRKRSRLICA